MLAEALPPDMPPVMPPCSAAKPLDEQNCLLLILNGRELKTGEEDERL
jgi:hypothetical protein